MGKNESTVVTIGAHVGHMTKEEFTNKCKSCIKENDIVEFSRLIHSYEPKRLSSGVELTVTMFDQMDIKLTKKRDKILQQIGSCSRTRLKSKFLALTYIFGPLATAAAGAYGSFENKETVSAISAIVLGVGTSLANIPSAVDEWKMKSYYQQKDKIEAMLQIMGTQKKILTTVLE
jgi:hypothetical protein